MKINVILGLMTKEALSIKDMDLKVEAHFKERINEVQLVINKL